VATPIGDRPHAPGEGVSAVSSCSGGNEEGWSLCRGASTKSQRNSVEVHTHRVGDIVQVSTLARELGLHNRVRHDALLRCGMGRVNSLLVDYVVVGGFVCTSGAPSRILWRPALPASYREGHRCARILRGSLFRHPPAVILLRNQRQTRFKH